MQEKKAHPNESLKLKVFGFFNHNNFSLYNPWHLGFSWQPDVDRGGKNLADRLEKSKHHGNQLSSEIPGLPHFLHGPPPIEPPPIGTLDGPGMSGMASLGQ